MPMSKLRIRLADGQVDTEYKAEMSGSGRLNRVTGEFSAREDERFVGKDIDTISEWTMNCIPARRKF
jgi:hypothetical protein